MIWNTVCKRIQSLYNIDVIDSFFKYENNNAGHGTDTTPYTYSVAVLLYPFNYNLPPKSFLTNSKKKYLKANLET